MARHPDKALSPVRINALKAKGRFADGNGLYLALVPLECPLSGHREIVSIDPKRTPA